MFAACNGGGTTRHPDGDDDFEDHAVDRINDVEQFRTLAAGKLGSTEVLKFVITRFTEDRHRRVYFLDSEFYELHDEWYWHRLLNGARVPGSNARPESHGFENPREATAWAKQQRTLPLNLRLVDGERLYSDRFYELAVDEVPRTFGVGSIVHLPAQSSPHPREELWGFELQYRDPATEHELTIFLESLEAALPEEIGEQLVWIVRSPEQARVARRLRERKRPLAQRIVDYAELALPGELEVYGQGLVAGRLRSFRAGDPRLGETRPTDILILESTPDYLPPAAGVITAQPQTPLSHVAILARNRGIPNAYVGGVMADPNLQQLARVHAPVIVRATADDVQIHPIDDAEYQQWQRLQRPPQRRVPGVDLRRVEYTIDLADVGLPDTQRLRPIIGGKAAGFLALRAVPGAASPDPAVAVTIRAYAEHIGPLRRTLEKMLRDPAFQKSQKLRFLILEGPKKFGKRFPDEKDFVQGFAASNKHAPVLREIVGAGGLRRMIRDRPISRPNLNYIERTLNQRFAAFSPRQGLRFRSSSTAEDIEGFTGAGLYVSSTGFLYPDQQTNEKERKRSVEWALKRTWASYWSAEAFEERKLAGVDHLSGNMAVLVHARFDDPLERANGVATLTLAPPGTGDAAVLEVNSQAGALSVANPPTDREVHPERTRVRLLGNGRIAIDRLASSSEVKRGRHVLEDATLEELLRDSTDVARAWLREENREHPPARARRTLVLDLEFRLMDQGWPASRDGRPAPPRLVIKQARSLEPGLPADPRLVGLPVPRDVLARASNIRRRSCRGSRLSVEVLEVLTDPLLHPDLGHERLAFAAAIELRGLGAVPGLEHHRGPVELTHLDIARVDYREAGRVQVDIAAHIHPTAARELGFDRIDIDARGQFRLRAAGKTIANDNGQCQLRSEMSTPDAFLLELLER